MNEATEKCAGGQDDGTTSNPAAIAEDHRLYLSVLNLDIVCVTLDNVQVVGVRNFFLHGLAVKTPVCLCARAANSRSLLAVSILN